MATKSTVRASVKHLQIDKNQSRMLIMTAFAAFFFAVMVVGGGALISQIKYQNKVISEKKKAVAQLRSNVQASSSLVSAYKAFVSTSQNVIGGNPQGTGTQDGDNAKIVLDALPSKYDFPALASSVEKMVSGQGMTIDGITGSDDELAQVEKQSSPTPEPIDMPIEIAATGNFNSASGLIDTLNRSIRPFQVQKVQVTGNQSAMSIRINANAYYQPAKNFNITKKVVK